MIGQAPRIQQLAKKYEGRGRKYGDYRVFNFSGQAL
jgi:hypothetical protein